MINELSWGQIMKELELIHGRWRKKLFRTNLLLTLMLFSVEIIMFFVLKKLTLIEQPILLYLKWFLVEPLLLNVAVLYIGHLVMKYIPENSVYINYIPILQMTVICMVAACVHNIFSMTLCLLCFPLFATIMFSDKKMTRTIGIICYVFLIIALVFRKVSVYRPLNDKYFWADIFVSLAILTATFIFCNVLITFSQEKTDMIQEGYLEQIHMKEQLNRDQKTGLYGHTIFMNTLEQKVESAKQLGNPFALAVIDIDDFKHVNDTYGHLKGDQVIISLADKMKKIFKEDQLIARYGGEEFAIIFSEKDLGQVSTRLEDLRCSFEKQRYDFMEDKITISIGIAAWKQGLTSEQIFEAADNAMYASKMEGKNRMTTHGLN
jgi:diguanylate cyclase (GGDEF)-like protein